MKIQDERMVNDAKNKETNMNKKMDNFARNLNGNLRSRNSTLYSEERNIGNKEIFRRPSRITKCL